jgi:hypothetical protein
MHSTNRIQIAKPIATSAATFGVQSLSDISVIRLRLFFVPLQI